MSDEELSKFEKLKKKMIEFDLNVSQILTFSLKREFINESGRLVDKNGNKQQAPQKN